MIDKTKIADMIREIMMEHFKNQIVSTFGIFDKMMPGANFHVAVVVTSLEQDPPKNLLVIGSKSPREGDEDTPTGPEDQALIEAALRDGLRHLTQHGEHLRNVKL